MSCSCGLVYIDRDGFTDVARVDCKKLSCPRCGPKRARRYRNAIGEKAEEFGLQRMMTLTLDPKNCTVENSIQHLNDAFADFRVALHRRYGKNAVKFIAVRELQKSGMAHMHVLINLYIPQAWISQVWQRVRGGSVVDIRFVDIHRIKHYLSKYLTKELIASGVPRRNRRITTSWGIRLFPKRYKTGWKYSSGRLQPFLEAERRRGVITNIVVDDAGLRSFRAVRTQNMYGLVEDWGATHREGNADDSSLCWL